MRTFHMTVTGDGVELDSSVAGVQGSGNVDKIVVTFDPAWDGYAKSAGWWDAHGAQAGEPKLLTADMLVDMAHGTNSYILLVPPQALAYAGRCSLVIDGYKDGTLARTMRQEFQVVPAPASAKGADVTPSQAQQLQEEIEALLGNMEALASSEQAQVAARVRFLQSIWETGERAYGYKVGYQPSTEDPGETEMFFPLSPPHGSNFRKHPIDGGEYQVTVKRGETVTVRSIYYADAPVMVGGVDIVAWWKGNIFEQAPEVDTLIVEYVPYMEDQQYSAKKHLEEMRSKTTQARDQAVVAKDTALGAKAEALVAKNAALDAKDAALDAKDAAQVARDAALGAKDAALGAKDTALGARTAAEQAKQDAEAAKTGAEAALEAAEAAKAAAEEAAAGAAASADASEDAAATAADAAGTAVEAADLATEQAGVAVEAAQESTGAAQVATAAAGVAEGVQAALHLRRRVRFGTATDAEGNLPGDTLIIIDDSTVGHSIDYQDLLQEAQKAAAGEENELETMAVLSVVNATNLRRTADGLLWTTDTLADFRAGLIEFAAAAVAAGYVNIVGQCVATWSQVQAWLITGALLTPLDAEAMSYPWRKEAPKTEFDAIKERLNAIEAQLDQAARRMYALTTGGNRE